MLTMAELNLLYIEKLQATGSHDDALRKVCWVAYQRGHADAVAGRPEQRQENEDGWSVWSGGPCPFSKVVRVDVILANGRIIKDSKAGDLVWEHKFERANIIKFKLSDFQQAPMSFKTCL